MQRNIGRIRRGSVLHDRSPGDGVAVNVLHAGRDGYGIRGARLGRERQRIAVVVIAVVGVVGADRLRLDGDVVFERVDVHRRREVDGEAAVRVSVALPVERIGIDDGGQRDRAKIPARLPFQRRTAACGQRQIARELGDVLGVKLQVGVRGELEARAVVRPDEFAGRGRGRAERMQAEAALDARLIHRLIEAHLNARAEAHAHRRVFGDDLGDHRRGGDERPPVGRRQRRAVDRRQSAGDRDGVRRPALQRRVSAELIDRGVEPFALPADRRREFQRLRQRVGVFGNAERHDRAVEDHGDDRGGIHACRAVRREHLRDFQRAAGADDHRERLRQRRAIRAAQRLVKSDGIGHPRIVAVGGRKRDRGISVAARHLARDLRVDLECRLRAGAVHRAIKIDHQWRIHADDGIGRRLIDDLKRGRSRLLRHRDADAHQNQRESGQ